MSKIYRRPMFRGGGKVSSYGNGIAAPLVPGYQMGGNVRGGIVNLPGGYNETANQRLINRIKNDFPINTVGLDTGDMVLGSELLAANKFGKTVAPVPGTVVEQKETVVEGKEGSNEIDTNAVDGSSLDSDNDQVERRIVSDGKGGTETVTSYVDYRDVELKADPNILVNLPAWMGGISKAERDKRLQENADNKLQNKLDAEGGKGSVNNYEPPQGGGADLGANQINAGGIRAVDDASSSPIDDTKLSGAGLGEVDNTTQSPEISARDAIAQNQELFKELLGSKKARGQDISDMLLRFSGSQGNTLGEKFQNYTRAESAAGPGRGEKINQTAAALSINDYVAGKRAKEQNQFLKTKIDYEYDKKAKLSSLNLDDDVATALAKSAKLTGGSFKSLKNIKNLINAKTNRDDIFEGNIKLKDLGLTNKDDFKQKKVNKLRTGYNIIEDDGVKRIVLIGNDGTNNTVISSQTITELWSMKK